MARTLPDIRMSVKLQPMDGLRERKKAAARQAMSDAATRLFETRGFEQVTLGEIADAAAVSIKTIYNYFGSKEDLFFDAETGILENLLHTVRGRRLAESPTDAVRPLLLTGPMLDTRCPWSSVDDRRYASLRAFFACERASPTLTARRLVIVDSWTAPLACEVDSDGWAAMLTGILNLRHRIIVDGLTANRSADNLAADVGAVIAPALEALRRAYPG
jgi:AcrR family transcriptional regulator